MRATLAATGLLAFLLHTRSAAQQPTAFVNVNVVPMDSEQVLAGQTIVVRDGRIAAVGSNGRIPVPRDARVIDGRGAYVMPGLADMHVHLRRDSNELLLYVANGVTTVRELSGEPELLGWKEEIAGGQRRGPNLIVASPIIRGAHGRRAAAVFLVGGGVIAMAIFVVLVRLSLFTAAGRRHRRLGALLASVPSLAAGYWSAGAIVPFPDSLLGGSSSRTSQYIGSSLEAYQTVRQDAVRYDLIKLYEGLSRRQFAAAIRAARVSGTATVGHVPEAVGFSGALESGLDELAHIYPLVVELQASTDTSPAQSAEQRHAAYRRRLGEIVAAVRRSEVTVTSTMMPMPELLEQWTDSTAFLTRDDMKYRPAATRRAVRELMRNGADPVAVRDVEMHIAWGAVAALELVRAGVPLVLGTDNAPFTAVAGFGAHEELRMLLAAGLTPYQALRTATVNASRVARASSRWGMVAVGMRADLILATDNPLADPGTLRQPRGVMVAGRWYSRADLDRLQETVVRRRAGS